MEFEELKQLVESNARKIEETRSSPKAVEKREETAQERQKLREVTLRIIALQEKVDRLSQRRLKEQNLNFGEQSCL